MNRSTIRFIFAMFVAIIAATSAFGPASAQSTPGFTPVRLYMQGGFSASGRHSVADDFVLVCPTEEVLDPTHPCSNNASAAFQPSGLDDVALVCPIKEVLDPSHPCANRRSQIIGAKPDKFVLVCPIKEVLDPTHPCAQRNIAKIKVPTNYVMTCPTKEVLDPKHPCANQ